MFSLSRRTKGEVVFDTLNNLGMLLICFVTLYPIWYVLINAFNDGKDAMLGGFTGGLGFSASRISRRYLIIRAL